MICADSPLEITHERFSRFLSSSDKQKFNHGYPIILQLTPVDKKCMVIYKWVGGCWYTLSKSGLLLDLSSA